MTHSETFCQRCGRLNARAWHAPSPLWNAVMRDRKTGHDRFGVVCPPCFVELADAKGLRFIWHFGPHEDVSALWEPLDNRVWDADQCLWVFAGPDEDPLYVPEPGTDDEPWTVPEPDPPADRRSRVLAVLIVALVVVAIAWRR